jgi:hypothetical protein
VSPESRAVSELDDEDAKLVTLAKGARGRVGAATGAALRDETGRTYSAANVALPSLRLGALQLAVAQAVAAGAQGCECAVVVSSDGGVEAEDLAAAHDLGGTHVRVLAALPSGEIQVDLPADLSTTQATTEDPT